MLSVTKSVAQKLKGKDVITPPKNRSSIRTLQMPASLMTVLEEHKERCRSFDTFDESYLICGGIKALRDTSVQKMNERFAEAAAVKVIRIHDFRHINTPFSHNSQVTLLRQYIPLQKNGRCKPSAHICLFISVFISSCRSRSPARCRLRCSCISV